MLRGVRGAITISQNDAATIQAAVVQLMDTLFEKNHIELTSVVSIFFTITPELTAMNPAFAIRHAKGEEWQWVPMICAQEPVMDVGMAQCIRVLVQWLSKDVHAPRYPVYLGEAEKLRPDLSNHIS